MSDLRDRLEHELGDVPVRQIDAAAIVVRTQRRARRRRVATSLLALAIAMGSLGLLLKAFNGTARGPVDTSTSLVPRIVFATVTWPDAPGQIYTMRPDGTHLQQITSGGAEAIEPAVSPDGSQIAFLRFERTSGPPGSFHEGIYVMNVDGSNMREILRTGAPQPISVLQLAWSPDGTQIGFVRWLNEGGSEAHELWIMNSDGSDAHRLVDRQIESFSWSPDGSSIAFTDVSVRDTRFVWDISIMDSDGSNVRALTHDGQSRLPAWSPDGTSIAFQRWIRQGVTHVYRLSSTNPDAEPQPVWTEDTAFDSLTWSPDSSAIAINTVDGKNGCAIVTVMLDRDLVDGARITHAGPSQRRRALPVRRHDRVDEPSHRSGTGLGRGVPTSLLPHLERDERLLPDVGFRWWWPNRHLGRNLGPSRRLSLHKA